MNDIDMIDALHAEVKSLKTKLEKTESECFAIQQEGGRYRHELKRRGLSEDYLNKIGRGEKCL